MWWWGKSAKDKLRDRAIPAAWTQMTLPDIAAYYSALDYDLAHATGLTDSDRMELRLYIDKQRKFLASRAPDPTNDWKRTAGAWNPLVSVDGMYSGSDSLGTNLKNQAEGAVARKLKADLIAKIAKRRRAQGYLY